MSAKDALPCAVCGSEVTPRPLPNRWEARYAATCRFTYTVGAEVLFACRGGVEVRHSDPAVAVAAWNAVQLGLHDQMEGRRKDLAKIKSQDTRQGWA